MGLGAFPAPHEQWLGMLGMHGTRTANYAMDEADLIVAIGARFDDRITGKLSEFAPRAKFIHIDIDPAEISKNVPAHIPIVGDARNIIPRLNAEYQALAAEVGRLEEWWSRIHTWQDRHPLAYQDSEDNEIKPQYMVQALYEATGGDAIVCSDVGQHQMWTAQHFALRQAPRAGSTPVAWARWASACRRRWAPRSAARTRPWSASSGDGSVQMNMQELATCAQEGIAIKVFIMNNGYLGMVRQWQELFWDKRYSQVDMGQWPDFVKVAEAYGATGMRLTDKRTLVDGHEAGAGHRRSGRSSTCGSRARRTPIR